MPIEKTPILKGSVYSLMKYCATRGVSLTIAEEEDHVSLHMDSVIYMDGFNKKVFQQVLQYLDICVEKVQELME